MVRRMKVEEALAMLQKLPKKGAEILYKAIHSAMANAEQNDNQKRKDLYIKELIVNRGPASRRYVPMARGRARPIDKFTSHISVHLGVSIPEGEKEKKTKTLKAGKKKEETKKPLEAEKVEGPIASAPGNPAKNILADDPHAAGSHDKQTSGTFIPHHHSSRGE